MNIYEIASLYLVKLAQSTEYYTKEQEIVRDALAKAHMLFADAQRYPGLAQVGITARCENLIAFIDELNKKYTSWSKQDIYKRASFIWRLAGAIAGEITEELDDPKASKQLSDMAVGIDTMIYEAFKNWQVFPKKKK